MGFHTKNADGLYGYAEIGEGAEIIGCLGHLDVVPAGDGWHYPPYAGTIDGGRLYAAHIGRCFIHLQSYFCIVLQ